MVTNANRQIATERAGGPVKDADRGKWDCVATPSDSWRHADASSRSSHADKASVRTHHAVGQQLRRRLPRRACRFVRAVEMCGERTCRVLSVWRACRRRRRRRRWLLPPAAAVYDRVGHRARRPRRRRARWAAAPPRPRPAAEASGHNSSRPRHPRHLRPHRQPHRPPQPKRCQPPLHQPPLRQPPLRQPPLLATWPAARRSARAPPRRPAAGASGHNSTHPSGGWRPSSPHSGAGWRV
jgi:hypothetical protein